MKESVDAIQFWRNPIFRRYCTSRMRPRGLSVALLLTVLAAGFIVALVHSISVRTDMVPEDALRPAVIALLVLQGLILFVLGTAQVAGGMTALRDEGVIDYDRLIPLPPLIKVMGFLFGLPVREWAMFLVTVPFSAWCLWQSGIVFSTWCPLYVVLLSSAIMYHLTGLVTGTVVKNRRWAFLISIGVVFALYTVIPQAAKFGMVFFKYLTITPVFQESLPELLPGSAGALAKVQMRLAPMVKFFDLDFPEFIYTLFSQVGLIFTFLIMLHRKWRREDAHLLGKNWATAFFLWIQILLLGNALPLIESGALFPSHGFSRFRALRDIQPPAQEAVVLSGIFGVVSLLLTCVLAVIVTPSRESQMRGWRRARKYGRSRLELCSDASTAFFHVFAMSVAGASGWYIFTAQVVESRWFPGHAVPLSIGVFFLVTLLAAALSFQAILEWRGGRAMGLIVIFIGAVPIMLGAVTGILSNRLVPAATWLTAISPVSLPGYASATLLTLSEIPLEASRALPRAFYFFLIVLSITAMWAAWRLYHSRRGIALSAQ